MYNSYVELHRCVLNALHFNVRSIGAYITCLQQEHGFHTLAVTSRFRRLQSLAWQQSHGAGAQAGTDCDGVA
jgi:hypothetical protein